MKIKKIISIALTLIVIFSFTTHTAHALPVPGTYFGGLSTALTPCTCGGTGPFIQMFSPLYFNSAPTVMWMSVPYTPLAFANYTISPGRWALGHVVPGAGVCLMYYGFGCAPIPLPVYGLITPMTGSSLAP